MFDNHNDDFDYDIYGWKMNPDVSPPIKKCNIRSPEIKIERVSNEKLELEEGVLSTPHCTRVTVITNASDRVSNEEMESEDAVLSTPLYKRVSVIAEEIDLTYVNAKSEPKMLGKK